MNDQVVYRGEVVGVWSHGDRVERNNVIATKDGDTSLYITDIAWSKRMQAIDKNEVIRKERIEQHLSVLEGVSVDAFEDLRKSEFVFSWWVLEVLDEKSMELVFDDPRFEPDSLSPEVDEDTFEGDAGAFGNSLTNVTWKSGFNLASHEYSPSPFSYDPFRQNSNFTEKVRNKAAGKIRRVFSYAKRTTTGVVKPWPS